MQAHNFLTYGLKIIFQTLGNIIYFPFWWYSVGFIETIKKELIFLRNQEKSLGFKIWLMNIFVPMYGQYDVAGRIISFFIRLIQIIARGLALIFWLALVIAGAILWLALPLLLVVALFFQAQG
ncbi:MAG TPA: hypothetical protein VFD16_03320 [Candidatus Saccharimonadales bacterium]|nr:hypothetical protein [Candidatus Saccharimonadales bacterium]